MRKLEFTGPVGQVVMGDVVMCAACASWTTRGAAMRLRAGCPTSAPKQRPRSALNRFPYASGRKAPTMSACRARHPDSERQGR
jgi:hypothetical protein